MDPENGRTEQPAPEHALMMGYAVEGGLGVLAVVIAWFAEIRLVPEVRFSATTAGWGLAGTLPMLAVLFLLLRVTWPPIARIREIVRTFASQFLQRANWLEIALLCILAGVGEELLFRGVLQELITGWTNEVVGIVLAGVAFGAVHFLTKTYFVLAVGVGCYLGWLYTATRSLTAPIVAHAVYDFIALAIVLHGLNRDQSGEDGNG